MKSSLKTFLRGENPLDDSGYFCKLKGSQLLSVVCCDELTGWFLDKDGKYWLIDVLDDGTAITYCDT